MVAKHSLRASPTDSLKWRIKIQNLQKRIIFNSNNFSIFGDYNINYIIKIFHTFNKISFLFPKHLISRFLITGNIIKIYIFISHSNHFWGVLQIWRISHTLLLFPFWRTYWSTKLAQNPQNLHFKESVEDKMAYLKVDNYHLSSIADGL